MRFFYEKKDIPVIMNYREKLKCGPHLHHHIELVYMKEGSVKAGADNCEVTVSKGDIFIAFPNQIHHYEEIDGGKSIIAIFSPDMYPEYRGILTSKIPLTPLVKNAAQNEIIPVLLEQSIKELNKQENHRDAIIRGYFLVLLGELFRMMEFEPIKTVDIDTLKGILIYCMQNYTKDIRLADLERDLHISRYYISHIFSSKLKMGFNDYINSLRVSEATRKLAHGDKSISDIAFSTGFNSLRSFNRAFSKFTGITPSEYRKNN